MKSHARGTDLWGRSFTQGKKQASVGFADAFPPELCHVTATSLRGRLVPTATGGGAGWAPAGPAPRRAQSSDSIRLSQPGAP